METEYHKTAGCYLLRKVNDRWQIVLIYRKWAEDNQGWVLPKGHIEDGETLEETAIRETSEETGYTDMKIIAPLDPLNIQYQWYDGKLHFKKINYFVALLLNDKQQKLTLSENEVKTLTEVKWFDLAEAEKMIKFDDERRLLKQVLQIISGSKF